ncbi:MAG: Nif3-like dinuclear metal center hexameric protein [Actinomycetales bacterium]|nr:Nif3-like dinuclear metal center hexameric protein [Actinomycetales bacterium]
MRTGSVHLVTESLSLRDAIQLLDGLYPPGSAESWDAVGLVAGDPSQEVRRVLFAVDPVAAVVAEAESWGADLLVTHHPLLLRAVHSVAATTFKGSLVHRLVRSGVALHVAHTNADSAHDGVAESLAAAIGVRDLRPLVPADQTLAGGAALAGDTALAGGTGLGRVGTLEADVTLRAFAQGVAAALPSTAHGVRVAGDLDATVRTVAVVGGAGDSLFEAVRDADVDVYVTADLRHHPASEARERAEFEGRGPALVDVSHFASEWPWLARAAESLRSAAARRGATVETHVSTLCTDPWSARFDSPEGDAP